MRTEAARRADVQDGPLWSEWARIGACSRRAVRSRRPWAGQARVIPSLAARAWFAPTRGGRPCRLRRGPRGRSTASAYSGRWASPAVDDRAPRRPRRRPLPSGDASCSRALRPSLGPLQPGRFDLRSMRHSGKVYLEVVGELGGANAREFSEAVRTLVCAGERSFVVDLGRVVDQSGVSGPGGRAYAPLRPQRRGRALCHPPVGHRHGPEARP